MILEYFLIGLSLIVAGAAAYRTGKNPSDLEKAVDKLRERVAALETETDNLRFRYWDALGDVAWLRVILSLHQIDIPPKPDNYKPVVDRYGNISIRIGDDTSGGVNIGGSAKVDVKENLVGGNKGGST